MRTAGFPASIFPSTICPSQSTSFHEGPNATFKRLPKPLTS
uniref:Uncharacterized protein n=1 Tax=Rhizophora mucronata TaxID=61149 RepID=A0A2P2KJC0_RHIMU